MPLVELGILLVCRMYHIHVGVVLKDCEDSESPQAQPMSLVTAHKENENPVKNPFPTTPLNLSWQPSPAINQKLDELNLELDLKANKENRKRNLDQSMESTGSSTSSRKHHRRSSPMVLHSKNTSVNNRRKPKNAPPEHHGELQVIDLILIWTAFFQRTVNMEQNQRISKKRRDTQCYRMRKT